METSLTTGIYSAEMIYSSTDQDSDSIDDEDTAGARWERSKPVVSEFVSIHHL